MSQKYFFTEIPFPTEIYDLGRIFQDNGYELYPVGGSIRDYLFSYFHGDVKNYNPKDIDLATDAQPKDVISMLESTYKIVPKGESFGVISVIIGSKEYEIATFREEWYDGIDRRPSGVKFSTAENDAKRRDLTINSLFYDLNNKKIIDYVETGIDDIKNRVIRFIGDARERILEDKLRILRLIRFFCRYNSGSIKGHLDNDTLKAIEEFRDLIGVSFERISNEFIVGVEKCTNVVDYLNSYKELDLFEVIFPGLVIDDFVGETKNIKAIFAWMFKNNKNISVKLRDLKYSSEIFNRVDFLIKLYYFDTNKICSYLKYRDLYKQDEVRGMEKKVELEKDVRDFAKIINKEKEMEYFLNYEPVVKSGDFLHLKGKEIEMARNECEKRNYESYI